MGVAAPRPMTAFPRHRPFQGVDRTPAPRPPLNKSLIGWSIAAVVVVGIALLVMLYYTFGMQNVDLGYSDRGYITPKAVKWSPLAR